MVQRSVRATVRAAAASCAFSFPHSATLNKPLRPREHQHDQQQRINDHARVADPQRLGSGRMLASMRKPSGSSVSSIAARMTPTVLPMPPRMTMTTMSMDLHEIEAAGRDELFEVRVKSAGDAGEKCADDERDDLVSRRVDAHRLGGDFVVVHGDEAAAVGGIDQRGDDVNRHRGEAERPKEIRVAGNAAQAARAADRVDVLENDADDFAETERDDGEIIAAQPQRRHADEQARQRRDKSADATARRETESRFDRRRAAAISRRN